MKMINKKSFFPIVCVVFTLLVLGKVILEAAVQGIFGGYQKNILVMFLLSLLGTLVISQHYRFQKLPLLAVVIVQYLVMIGVVMVLIRVASFFGPIHKDGYRDMALSFSIPYGIAAAVYYISLLYEVKRVNQALGKIRRNQDEKAK